MWLRSAPLRWLELCVWQSRDRVNMHALRYQKDFNALSGRLLLFRHSFF